MCRAGKRGYPDHLGGGFQLKENRSPAAPGGFSERHLHCLWYDPKLRPALLREAGGLAVRIEHPGTWNRSAGPDFLGASVRVGPSGKRVTGDCEIHLHPSGWKQHQHIADPRYQGVRIHVTYHPGTVEPGLLPPHCLELALGPILEENPLFTFDAVDLLAYPYASRATEPPCAGALKRLPLHDVGAFLEAAGVERLKRKTVRMRHRLEKQGAEQALYEECMAALGYRHNAAAFRQLATRTPVARMRDACGDDDLSVYAILLGTSGLLPGEPGPGWDSETRTWFRAIWDRWWMSSGPWKSAPLPASAWRLDGLRPANHPLRRLRAASLMVARPPGLEKWVGLLDGTPVSIREAATWFDHLRCPYWDYRMALGGPRRERRTALVGRQRVQDLLLNVGLPGRAALEDGSITPQHLTGAGSHSGGNAVVRKVAFWLLGRDHSAALYSSALRKQGLLQVFEDFCVHDRSTCSRCPLPAWLGRQGR